WAVEHGLGAITNVVFMGMGEPLANRRAVMPALTLLNATYGLGARRITVSTVGIVPGILELAARPEQFRLAVSLHAPNSELRAKLVPVEKKYPLPTLLEALRAFEAAGGRRITFEYVLIDGINDDLRLAGELATLVAPFAAHVNLIPFNPVPGTGWQPPSRERQRAFAAVLEQRGVPVTVRGPRGRDIAAACGQLRAEHALRPPRPFLTLSGRAGAPSSTTARTAPTSRGTPPRCPAAAASPRRGSRLRPGRGPGPAGSSPAERPAPPPPRARPPAARHGPARPSSP